MIKGECVKGYLFIVFVLLFFALSLSAFAQEDESDSGAASQEEVPAAGNDTTEYLTQDTT